MQDKKTTSTQSIRLSINALTPEAAAAKIKESLPQLALAHQDALEEYYIYEAQKDITQNNCQQDVVRLQSLFASDFSYFKSSLNTAIRAFNEFKDKYKIFLNMMGHGSSTKKEWLRIEKSLQELKGYYLKDKALYFNSVLPKNPDLVPRPNSQAPPETKSFDNS